MPPLVLFSIGAVAAIVGKLSWVVWTASIVMGFIQSFTYAEIAGLFPNKSGGTSIYGAIAWVRYGKLIAPISVWCNWFAWSPVQAIGSGLAAGYILNGLFAPDSVINTWQLTLLDLGAVKTGLSLRINAVFVLGAVILIAVKLIQDGGILRSANTTKILGISAMIPLILIGIVPLLTGDIVKANFFPLVPLAHDAAGTVSERQLEHGGLHGDCRRHVPRRLVDLRLRDRGVLHGRIQESEDRHLQGDLLLRPAVRGRLHPGAVCLPGLPGPGRAGDTRGGRCPRRGDHARGLRRHAGARHLQRHGRRGGDGADGALAARSAARS